MKKIIKFVKTYPACIILFCVMILFLPQNLAKAPESSRNAIITTVGVDSVNDEFEITFLSFQPTPGQQFIETYEAVSSKAPSLSEALINAGKQVGKDIQFFHTEVLILGNSIVNQDIYRVLEFFVRDGTLSSSVMLAGTNTTAKELIETINKQENNPVEVLSELMLYNSSKVFPYATTIESFLSGYYSPVHSGYIAMLTLDEEDENEILLNKSNQEQNGASEQKENLKKLHNKGDIIVFRENECVGRYPYEIVRGLSWFEKNNSDRTITINNIEMFGRKNENVIFHVKNENTSKAPIFDGDQAILNLKVKVKINSMELSKESGQNVNIEIDDINDDVREKIEEEIKDEVKQVIQKMKVDGVDLAGIYRQFYIKEKTKFKKLLKMINKPEKLLEYIDVKVDIEIVTD